jgi:RsiW-degrading membrane proteinase PrsW (M82 family)
MQTYSPPITSVLGSPPLLRRRVASQRLRRALSRVTRPHHLWPRVFRVGLLMWAASVLVTRITGNPTLVPTVILLGSFLVPITFTVFAWEHRSAVSTRPASTAMVVRAATLGGLLGLLAAASVEQLVLRPNLGMYYEVGLIEEAAKLAALLWIARMLAARTMRDGLVLGASVGFGFAALESAGYAFDALFTPHGLSFASLVDTEVLRALLAPFGHGVWTAVAGAAWFAAFPSGAVAARRSRKQQRSAATAAPMGILPSQTPATRHRPAKQVAVAAFFLVAMLHAAFDGMHGLVLTLLNLPDAIRTGSLHELWNRLVHGTLRVPAGAVSYQVAYDGGLLLVIVLGLAALLVTSNAIRHREGPAPDHNATPALSSP